MPLWKDLYFTCPACRGHLVVERSGAGYSAPCPHCTASVRVPHRSSLPPKLARTLRLVGLNGAVVLLVTAGVLFALGSFRPASPEAVADTAAATRPAGAPPAPAARARAKVEQPNGYVPEERNRELVQAHAELQSRYDDLGNWVLQNVRGKFPLNDRLLNRLDLAPVDENFMLHGDVVEVLNVKPEEKALVDDALIATRDTLNQMELAMLTVTQTAPHKATLYIPAYADSGEQARQDLYQALSTALGEARFNRLLDMTQRQLEKQYHYFGTAQRTMVFELASTEENPDDAFLVIKDGWIRPDGEHGRTYEVSENSVRELPAQYSSYLNLLPAYVAAFAKP
jgi:hypothetical protein